MKNPTVQNSHNNSHNNAPPDQSGGPAASALALPVQPPAPARPRLPASVTERRFRADSFAAKLTLAQRSTLFAWLKTDSIEKVRQKVAAPPPSGFGLETCSTTLQRLKHLLENARMATWISESMDTACDLLQFEDASEVTPLRDALALMLYTRAIHFAKEQAPVENIDKLLAAITKLEKLKMAASPASPGLRPLPSPPLTTRHHVELSIQATPSAASPRIIAVNATPLPAPHDPASNPQPSPPN